LEPRSGLSYAKQATLTLVERAIIVENANNKTIAFFTVSFQLAEVL